MMEFTTLSSEEFRKFANNHEQESFFQTVEMADLRSRYGSIVHYVGVKKKGKIIAASMLTETDCMFGKKRFYAARGYLIDYHNKELLKFFTDNVKKYAKRHNGMVIKIEPNILYRMRNTDGSIMANDERDDEAIQNLKDLGYVHYGFRNDFVNQSRFNYWVKLDKPYEELKKTFSKSTRKNIDSLDAKGVRVRCATKEELPFVVSMLKETGDRKAFKVRDLKYFENMMDAMGDLVTFYIAYIDTKAYLENSRKLLEDEENKLSEIEKKMTHDMVGSKLLSQKETCLKLIEKYKREIEEAEALHKEYPDGKDIATLVSLVSGDYHLTLHSGMDNNYRKFIPKYAMYNRHIQDAYEKGLHYVDFYGISGNFDPSDKYYSIFEIKKGFNGNVVELIGEFTLKVSFHYSIYRLFRKAKYIYRKITKSMY